jgi:hypothetical protein
MGLPADEFDECALDDNASAVDGVAQPPVLTTFPAPPAVAPQQVSYVASQAGVASGVCDASTAHSARSPLMIVADGMMAHAAE